MSSSGRPLGNYGSGLPGKMLLPALKKPGGSQSPSTSGEKQRTLHACDNCRKAKAKCSGGRPCVRCRADSKPCVYGDGKRDKDKKDSARALGQASQLQQANAELISVLQSVLQHGIIDHNVRQQAEDTIAKSSDLVTGNEMDVDTSSQVPGDQAASVMHSKTSGEQDANAEVGSMGSIDAVSEDVNRDSETKAVGFLGKSATATWMQRVDDFNFKERTGLSATNPVHARDSGKYMTGEPGPTEMGVEGVNEYDLPSPEVGRHLVSFFMTHVYPAYPLMIKARFLAGFESLLEKGADAFVAHNGVSSLCLVNVVLAIGSKYAQLSQARRGTEHYDDGSEHLMYYARAQKLAAERWSIFHDTDLQNTSSLGLLSIYFISVNQLSRAFSICGLAMRQAVALGLHLRNTDKGSSPMDKEVRNRIFWALYCLEQKLSSTLGRPGSVAGHHISAPLPLNINEEELVEGLKTDSHDGHSPQRGRDPPSFNEQMDSELPPLLSPRSLLPSTRMPSMSEREGTLLPSLLPNLDKDQPITSSTYLRYFISLSIISHEVMSELYCAATAKTKWSYVQRTIRRLDSRICLWRSCLPAGFNFAQPQSKANQQYEAERTSLEMEFSSLRMIIFRPTLCRIEGRISNESSHSRNFDHAAVQICVSSAQVIVRLVRSSSSVSEAFQKNSWLMTLDYINQAASVLLLEIVYSAQHMPQKAHEILQDCKQAMLWLREMSKVSVPARRSWEVFDDALRGVAGLVGGNMKDMPRDAPMPMGYEGKGKGKGKGNVGGMMDGMVDGADDNDNAGFVGGIGSISPRHGMHRESASFPSHDYFDSAMSFGNPSPHQDPAEHYPPTTSDWVDQQHQNQLYSAFANTGSHQEHEPHQYHHHQQQDAVAPAALNTNPYFMPGLTTTADTSFLHGLHTLPSSDFYGSFDEFDPWRSVNASHALFPNMMPTAGPEVGGFMGAVAGTGAYGGDMGGMGGANPGAFMGLDDVSGGAGGGYTGASASGFGGGGQPLWDGDAMGREPQGQPQQPQQQQGKRDSREGR